MADHRSRAGRHWDLDADAWDHRQRKIDRPELRSEERRDEVGRILGPSGHTIAIVHEPERPFGFVPQEKGDSDG